MNWIKEIKYFYDWLGDHTLSHGAQALWFYLMYRNNACALPTTSGEWLWRVEFTVRVEHLEQALGCDYRSVIRYRKELAEAGLLKYQKAVKGRHPGIYTIIPFVKNLGPVTRENLGGGQVLVYDYVGGMHDITGVKNSQNRKMAADETTALSSF